MYSFNLQNAFIIFLKNTQVFRSTVIEAFYSVQENEISVWLILKEIDRCVFYLDTPFGDFSHKSTSVRQYGTVFCLKAPLGWRGITDNRLHRNEVRGMNILNAC